MFRFQGFDGVLSRFWRVFADAGLWRAWPENLVFPAVAGAEARFCSFCGLFSMRIMLSAVGYERCRAMHDAGNIGTEPTGISEGEFRVCSERATALTN